jgi:hypothetical protein
LLNEVNDKYHEDRCEGAGLAAFSSAIPFYEKLGFEAEGNAHLLVLKRENYKKFLQTYGGRIKPSNYC